MANNGFTAAKNVAIARLATGAFLHEARASVEVKNHLKTGQISAQDVINLLKKSNGNQHSSSPHHRDASLTVHVIVTGGYYIKFYFIDPNVMFISVHP
ncbi:hypothetical protein KR767_18725 [Luteibacter anthropi]|uniref:hypothetical protein n=1 Tax=Luteibacter anthropi TaxID=564369 RepID=UPI002032E758|nr:hypothetical protein [Luteibacter anthropi]URX62056.1 hypothetical protein KR767_18725 [Luteibacter anthropi]